MSPLKLDFSAWHESMTSGMRESMIDITTRTCDFRSRSTVPLILIMSRCFALLALAVLTGTTLASQEVRLTLEAGTTPVAVYFSGNASDTNPDFEALKSMSHGPPFFERFVS